MFKINSSDIRNFKTLLAESEHVTIVTHMKPDGDAMGSSLGMYHFLKGIGKEDVKIIISDRYPKSLDFMADAGTASDIMVWHEMETRIRETVRRSDLMICLDFNAFHRTDALEDLLTGADVRKVLIDHHLNPEREHFCITFSETEVSSASELLFWILMEMPQINADASLLPLRCAEALMTGMTTDTNNFANSTFPSTLRMASALLEAGVDRDRIISDIYNRYGENRLRLMGFALYSLLKITPEGVAYMILDKETIRKYSIEEGDTEGFVNLPLMIDSVKMSILLKEDTDRIRVSIRSKKGVSANRCAREFFNGGGHENASGGRLQSGRDIDDISQAAKYIEECTSRFMKEQ